MNTTIDDSKQREALKVAIDARALTRARLEAAAATLTRAERISGTAQDKVEALEQAGADTETEHARQLEAMITAGGPTPTLPAVIDESAVAALDSARLHASITAKALASLEASHAQAQRDAQTTEAAVKAAVNALLTVEAEQLAAEIMDHQEHTLALRTRLSALREENRSVVSAAACLAIDPPGVMSPMAWAHPPTPPQMTAARAAWRDRIRSLTAGESDASDAARVAA